ncbi:MAG: glycosyltransferase family 1 protein [Pseudomonadota bacterium]
MNILFDHHVFSEQRYGGISRYFYEIGNRIADLPGNRVEIFAPIYVNEYFNQRCKVRPWGIKTKPLPRLRRIVDLINRDLPRLLVKPRRDVDIFHETSYSMMDYCPASAKRVVTVYDMIHEKFPQYFHNADEARKIKEYVVQRADHIICISESTKRDLIDLFAVPEEKISVVYLGGTLASDSIKEAVCLSGIQKPYLLYVGARQGYKNFEALLHVYADSPLLRHEFNLVCFGGGSLSVAELELIKILGISSECITQLSDTDEMLAGLYASAAALIYPSLYEGFGIPPLEAMLLGCPVICANTSSIPEVVGDAAELFNPYDETEMRAAIERVVSSPQYAATLIEKGRQRVNFFSWKKCATETLNVYHNILGAE